MAAKPTPKPVAKSTAKPAAKPVAAKPSPKPTAKAAAKPTGKASPKVVAATVKSASPQPDWLQDASLEVPVPAHANYLPGDRELEFSVGMRQQDADGMVRSELRGRALVHAGGEVLVMVEASYVNMAPQNEVRPDVAQYLYTKLRGSMESLLALAGHTPPLPTSLEKVA